MRDSENFDERQLMERGKIFKHAFILLVILFVADAFAKDFGIEWIENGRRAVVIIAIVTSFSSIRLILKDAYRGSRGYWNVGMIIFSAASVILLGLSFSELLNGSGKLVENGKLSSITSSLIIAICFISISLVYWIRYFKNRRAELNDSN